MIELIVKGNKDSYQNNKIIENIEIVLRGRFDYRSEDQISFIYDNQTYLFKNRTYLQNFTEEIRGKNLEELNLIFIKYKFDSTFINKLANKSLTEIGLIKSVFLIYFWLDLSLSHPEVISPESKLFNEFIVDWTNQPESQRNIYFINKKYITEHNLKFIKKLMGLNLLASCSLETPSKNNITTYFIPLNFLGVSREHFKSEFDINGDSTFKLWKDILEDRDIRITNWVNNRF